ncbi:MAG: undecaprenyl-diphosphate phosphatase [Firmicutes bacterium]|uniref:Undecaprenyl-diphosphatase n=1 Tax=Candidatus Scybalomonas excrementavium TaxID=2840943 RepID=A0A9D9I1T1_9FIRM|nr:undecaprenyl-diphosphate phosphatase [Candidatus Scybalomonas excrementavium]
MDIIEILKVIVIGIVEGITEWLPVSSTGHMILVEKFWPLSQSEAFIEMFNVVIQLGAIMAVVVLFFHKLNPFSPRYQSHEKKEVWSLWFKVLIATVPAAILGLLFDDWLNEKFYNFETVACTLILYGVLFIVVENWNKTRSTKIREFYAMSYQTALLIGVFQILALIPGTSRSGATIIGAMLLGCSRYIAAEFSFFLAIPVMFGASALKIVKFVKDTGSFFSGTELTILIIGMAVAFVVSLLCIKFLMSFVKAHDFKIFGYYRIVLGILLLVVWIMPMFA